MSCFSCLSVRVVLYGLLFACARNWRGVSWMRSNSVLLPIRMVIVANFMWCAIVQFVLARRPMMKDVVALVGVSLSIVLWMVNGDFIVVFEIVEWVWHVVDLFGY